jgi:PAS domain S-box-containing protein
LVNLAEQQYAIDQHAIVAVTDVKGTIIFTNEKISQISGYTEKELLGKNHRILNSGYHDKAFFEDMYRTITRGNVWHGEICNKAKAGHLYWVDATIVPIMGDNNKPRSYIAIRTDITEKKRNEVQLREALDALREKQELLKQEEKIAQHVFANITASNNDDIDELTTWYEPMGSFSGDLVLSSLLPDGGLRIILCDFTGHGLPAALGAVPVSSIYTAITSKNLPLSVLMEELNNKLNTFITHGNFLLHCRNRPQFRAESCAYLECWFARRFIN